MNESGTLDPAAIERLRKLGGDKFALQMIELFLSYCGQKVAETRQQLQTGNLAGVAEAAHPVKSSAGNVGAVVVQERAARVEQSARESKTGELAAQINELEQAFAEAAARLEAEKSKLMPKPV